MNRSYIIRYYNDVALEICTSIFTTEESAKIEYEFLRRKEWAHDVRMYIELLQEQCD